MSEVNVRYGRNLRDARVRMGLSQQQVIDQLRERGHRWMQARLSKLEIGEQNLRLEDAVLLCDVLGITVAELVGADEQPAGTALAVAQLRAAQRALDEQINRLEGTQP